MNKSQRQIAVPSIGVHDIGWNERTFLEALLNGLSAPQKCIPCQFLYDPTGAQLFDQICDLPEYYLTRTETRILQSHAYDIARLIGPDAVIYELGSGSSVKTPILLDKLERPHAYVPIDVSRENLVASAAEIAAAYPNMRVEAVCGDYGAPQLLPEFDAAGRPVAFFPGSTIGNLTQRDAIALLRLWRAHLGSSGLMVIGADLKKDPALLNRAYNDEQGLTAQFIKNVLAHANANADADFDLDEFDYEAEYDPEIGAVRMHLVARSDQEVTIAGRAFYFARDERLHVEDSHKYSPEDFAEIAHAAGFSVARVYTDPRNLFSVQILRAAG